MLVCSFSLPPIIKVYGSRSSPVVVRRQRDDREISRSRPHCVLHHSTNRIPLIAKFAMGGAPGMPIVCPFHQSKHSRLHSAGVVQCVTVQSQQTKPAGQRIELQSGGGVVQPVASDPGGQHCAAMVTVWADERFAYGACLRKKPSRPDVPASAVNPGNLISHLLVYSDSEF